MVWGKSGGRNTIYFPFCGRGGNGCQPAFAALIASLTSNASMKLILIRAFPTSSPACCHCWGSSDHPIIVTQLSWWCITTSRLFLCFIFFICHDLLLNNATVGLGIVNVLRSKKIWFEEFLMRRLGAFMQIHLQRITQHDTNFYWCREENKTIPLGGYN